MISAIETLAAMRQAIIRGERSTLVALARTGVMSDSSDHITMIDIGNCLRDVGEMRDASDVYNNVLSQDATNEFALFEAATLNAMEGRHTEALLSLERILKKKPDDARTLAFAARMRARIGDKLLASAYVTRLDEVSANNSSVAWLRELVSFMDEFPAGVITLMAQEFEQSSRYVSADIIAGWAAASLREGQGFSLVRLGDGEGAFCRISSEDEARFSAIYAHCRQDRSHVWFNGETDINTSGFTEVAFELRSAISNANVVGLPYSSWIAHEHRYCSPTGIVCLANALRLCRISSVNRTQSWTTQLSHMELLQKGLLEALVRTHKRINLISCLSDAPEALHAAFDVEVNLYRIPGEKAHAEQLGQSATVGEHFPARFNEVMQELDRPCSGQLFLVAGGLLGKLYCDRIKRNGGVALDIGSVIDIWMGKLTRPGSYDHLKLKI